MVFNKNKKRQKAKEEYKNRLINYFIGSNVLENKDEVKAFSMRYRPVGGWGSGKFEEMSNGVLITKDFMYLGETKLDLTTAKSQYKNLDNNFAEHNIYLDCERITFATREKDYFYFNDISLNNDSEDIRGVTLILDSEFIRILERILSE